MAKRHASAAETAQETVKFEQEDGRETRVAVLLPLPLDTAYDYAVPTDRRFEPGTLVRVPIGQREMVGVVWDQGDTAEPVAQSRLRMILEPIDLPPLPANERRFIDWVADYTMARRGSVLRMGLSVPAAFEPPRPLIAYRRVDSDPAEDDTPDSILQRHGQRLTPARRRVLEVLSDGPPRPIGDLAREAGVSPSVVKGLETGGVIEAVALPHRSAFAKPDGCHAGPELSTEQCASAEALRDAVADHAFSVTLLDGVTGAGKTEVYFEAVAAALAADRQALVLLPEIALSTQWLQRFEDRFGVRPAVWHSDLTAGERRHTWRAVAKREAFVVVGARSALFLPFQDLGLVVVDEEQDTAFKQEDGVIYHARDMAVVRARFAACPLVLVSATPSLESVTNVASGRYHRIHLPERHGAAVMPDVTLVDLRKDPPPRLPELGQSWLSAPLREALEETFAAGQQALLFLNRRGFAPLTLCRTCGHRFDCPNCTAWLVEHRLAGKLQCHHCGYWTRPPTSCPSCGAEESLAASGPGIERLAEEARLLFPEQRLALISSDSLRGPAQAQALVKAIQDREIDLLIGTQIIAKGHHFPFLTLVGVVDGDLGLAGGDLRAAERTYQLLHQVAGRAGRAEQPGRVMIQTHDPEHPVMQALASSAPDARDRFLDLETELRRQAGLPPFARLAAIIVTDVDERRLDDFCRALARRRPSAEGVEVFGPAPAPLAVLRRRHRRRFLIRTRRDIKPQDVIRPWLEGVKMPGSLRLQIDIDPYSFL